MISPKRTIRRVWSLSFHESPKSISIYSGVIILGCVLCTWPISKHWLKHWGSHPDEHGKVWPGDRFVSPNDKSYTRAIDIGASAGAVWQWVVQFGLERAGFYSYELLERLGGVPVTNLESIEPTMQSLAVGDEIRLHPNVPGIVVEDLLPERHICSVQYDADSEARPVGSWSLYIVPTAADKCRLVLRSCLEPLGERSLLKRVGDALEKPLDFVMEQRMLRTIKRLAELHNY